MKVLKPILFLSFLACLLASCSKPVSPTFVGYQNFRLLRAGLNNTVLATDVKLYNPNKYPLQLKSAAVDVYMNNSFLGHSSLDSLIILPALDTAYVPVQLKASAKDILANTAKLLLNPNATIKITGSVRAGRNGFFINVPVNYEGNQRIDLLGK